MSSLKKLEHIAKNLLIKISLFFSFEIAFCKKRAKGISDAAINCRKDIKTAHCYILRT